MFGFQVTGHVEGKNGKVPGYSISGTWSNRLCADFGNGPQEIWKKSSPAPEPTRCAVKLSLLEVLEFVMTVYVSQLAVDKNCLF